MRRLVVLFAFCCTLAPLSAAAHTQEDASACMPDAFRLCASAIPDRARVRACRYSTSKRNLSKACAAVIDRARAAAAARTPSVQKTGY